MLLKIELNFFKGLKPKTKGQVTTGKIGTKGVNPNPRCIKKSKFITQNKWAMHLFNLSILIMQSCMRLNNGFTRWNVRRLEFLHESKSFIKSKSLRTIVQCDGNWTFENSNLPVLRLFLQICKMSKFSLHCRVIAYKSVSAGLLITWLSVKRFTDKSRLLLAF